MARLDPTAQEPGKQGFCAGQQSNYSTGKQSSQAGHTQNYPQRSLKFNHVDSLLLFKPSSPSKMTHGSHRSPQSSQGTVPRRITPARSAKRKMTYRVNNGSPDNSDFGIVDSEWQGSFESCEDDSTDEDDTWIYPMRPLRTFELPPGESLFQNSKSAAQYTEATSMNSRRSSSSENGFDAILRFSPPRTKSPLKRTPVHRARTPSPSPLQRPTNSSLISPTKLQKVPPSPHRPSIDAFWSADVINAWNEEYSPRKILGSPKKLSIAQDSDGETIFSPSSSPRRNEQKKSPAKTDREAREAKKMFDRSKHLTAEDFLRELDNSITNGKIAEMAAPTGGVKIVWSRKLNSTAGRAHWRREAVKNSRHHNTYVDDKDKSKGQTDADRSKNIYRHFASIELAEKVIDDETRLLNVLAHEYCHLANFMISSVKDQPHGASFKKWAALVSKNFARRGVVVTTKHSYQIQYKYAWMCCNSDCGVEYARHSRSIDPNMHTCGKCRGLLKQIRPAPRKGGKIGDTSGAASSKTEYQRYFKENFAAVRSELGQSSPMKDVMREIGVRYRMKKDELTTQTLKPSDAAKTVDANSTEVIELSDDEDENETKAAGYADVREPYHQVGEHGEAKIDEVSRVLTSMTIRDD